LLSPDYIERTVEALYQDPGVASACGGVLPLRLKDRRAWAGGEPVRGFYARHPDVSYIKQRGRFGWFLHGLTNIYRDFLYFHLRSFIYRGQMALFGSIVNPTGCAVAYRREYIREVFDHFEPLLGDDLTTSEDIFIGFALLQRGYRNVQVSSVYALSEEPFAHRLPRQVYLWSSAFFQSCYYFPDLVLSPFKAFRRRALRRREEGETAAGRCKPAEACRQASGMDYTKQYGRPIGWTILFGLFEKISLPLVLVVLALLRNWDMFALTMIVEIIVLLALVTIMSLAKKRPDYIWKAIVATPVRYFMTMFDLGVFLSFLVDVWFVRDFKWRK